MTDALIKTTVKYQDTGCDPYQPPIIHITREEYERKQDELRSKAEGGKDNPFKPDGQIYKAADPIVEHYKFGPNQSRPTSPVDSQKLIEKKKSDDDENINKKETKNKKKKDNTANKTLASQDPSARKSCWRRWCCCCCCGGGGRKNTKSAINENNQAPNLPMPPKNDNENINTNKSEITSVNLAEELQSKKTKEELKAKRSEFIKNAIINSESLADEQSRYVLNLQLPESENLITEHSDANNDVDEKSNGKTKKNKTSEAGKQSKCVVS